MFLPRTTTGLCVAVLPLPRGDAFRVVPGGVRRPTNHHNFDTGVAYILSAEILRFVRELGHDILPPAVVPLVRADGSPHGGRCAPGSVGTAPGA